MNSLLFVLPGLSAPSAQLRKSSGLHLGSPTLHHALKTLSRQLAQAAEGLSSFVSRLLGITVLHFLVSSVLFFFPPVVSGRGVNLVPVTPSWLLNRIFKVYVYIRIGAQILLLLLLLQMWWALTSCAFKLSFFSSEYKFNKCLSKVTEYNSLHCCFCKLLGT